MEPTSQFDAQAEKENAELQAELALYNQQHGTNYSYPDDANALFYEFEGGGVQRDQLLNFPKLLKFWDDANVANEWEVENDVKDNASMEEDNLPF